MAKKGTKIKETKDKQVNIALEAIVKYDMLIDPLVRNLNNYIIRLEKQVIWKSKECTGLLNRALSAEKKLLSIELKDVM